MLYAGVSQLACSYLNTGLFSLTRAAMAASPRTNRRAVLTNTTASIGVFEI